MTTALLPIGTKSAVPKLPDSWLRRARLNDRCSQMAPRDVMLVAAFAGSGKTMLLADWIANDCRIERRAWITFDARDNAPGRLSGLVAHALEADSTLDELLGRNCSDTTMLDRVFEDVESRSQRWVLVLDDVHELTSRHAIRGLAHLVLRVPANVSIVISTRADPPVPLARLQVEGRLRQLRTRDLALTREEAGELFVRHDLHLESNAIDALMARTGGWAGGIRLAALALADEADSDLFVENAVRTDGLISDYLVHEVLERQSLQLQTFLLRTSVAQPLTAELARELSGDPDSDALIADLDRSGVFVTHYGHSATTYQFHALFGELLRARLRHEEPELAASLLARAAQWFVAHGMPVEAEAHAYQAGNLQLAGSLSVRRWVREVLAGASTTPVEVPVAIDDCAAFPELALIAAVNATVVGDRRNAVMWRARLDALAAWDDEEPWLAVARLLLDVWQGRAFGTDVRARAACRALLAIELDPFTPTLHAVTRLREAELLLDTDDDEGTLRALLDGRWRASRNAAPWIVDECDVLLALIASTRGRLDSCDTLLNGIPARGEPDPIVDTRRLTRALCDAQRGRLQAARAALVSEPVSPGASHAVRAGIEEALRCLDGGVNGPSHDVAGSEHPLAASVRVALGVLDGATLHRPEVAVAAGRRLVAKQRDEQVVELLEPFVSGCNLQTHLRTRVEALILLTIAADRLGDHELALTALRTALDLASPPDLRSPFLAHAAALGPVVDRYSWQLAGASRYAAELVDDLHPEELPVFVEPLTSRELAVLEYLPTMMTNTEIAHQLLVSVNTVKTHLKSVYRKLGVDRRRDAVIRAKQLDVL